MSNEDMFHVFMCEYNLESLVRMELCPHGDMSMGMCHAVGGGVLVYFCLSQPASWVLVGDVSSVAV